MILRGIANQAFAIRERHVRRRRAVPLIIRDNFNSVLIVSSKHTPVSTHARTHRTARRRRPRPEKVNEKEHSRSRSRRRATSHPRAQSTRAPTARARRRANQIKHKSTHVSARAPHRHTTIRARHPRRSPIASASRQTREKRIVHIHRIASSSPRAAPRRASPFTYITHERLYVPIVLPDTDAGIRRAEIDPDRRAVDFTHLVRCGRVVDYDGTTSTGVRARGVHSSGYIRGCFGVIIRQVHRGTHMGPRRKRRLWKTLLLVGWIPARVCVCGGGRWRGQDW